MSENEVRLQYSGYVIFLSRIVSIGTGLAFSLMVTRSISAYDFGIYGNLSDLLSYFTMAASAIPFWATRFIARRRSGSSKTGLVANLLVTAPFMVAYFLLLPWILSAFQISNTYLAVYLLLAAEIGELYIIFAFEGILQATKPQSVGFGFFIFEISKVALGAVLIFLLQMGLMGALISVISAYILQLLFYAKTSSKTFREKIRWIYIEEWTKASPINFYGIVGGRLANLYLFFLFIFGGTLSRAYYEAALIIAASVGHSSLLAYALYPRLLSKDSPEDIKKSLNMVLMFGLPMTTGVIALSECYLAILDPVYRVAIPVLVPLAIGILFSSLSTTFEAVIMGTEKFDVGTKVSFRKAVRSKLFLIMSLPYARALVTIPALYLILRYTFLGPLEIAVLTALIFLFAEFALASARFEIARRSLRFALPWKPLIKYLLACAVMAVILIISRNLIANPFRLSAVIAMTILGGISYLITISLIDAESRTIGKYVLNKILRTMSLRKSMEDDL